MNDVAPSSGSVDLIVVLPFAAAWLAMAAQLAVAASVSPAANMSGTAP